MTNLFIEIYHFFTRHRAIWIVSMAIVFSFFGYFSTKIHLEEDIVRLLPSSRNEDGSIKLAFSNLRIKDKTFIVFEDQGGVGVDSICKIVDHFCDTLLFIENQLPEDKKTISDIFYGINTDDLLFEAVAYAEDHLPCYIDTSCYASFDTLLNEVSVDRHMRCVREQSETLIGQVFPELLTIDPIGMRYVLQDKMLDLRNTLSGSYKLVNGHLFVPDSTMAIVILTPLYSGTDSGHNIPLVERINGIRSYLQVNAPDVNIGYYGTTVRGAYNSWVIKHDILVDVIGSLSLILLFLGLCFRNFNTIPMLLLPVLFGAVFGLSMMYFIKGHFSLLALGIGAIVLGVALSYVLHIITHYKYVGDPEQVLRDQVKPVLMGCITTIGSFMGLFFINTDLLQDFGCFASFAIVGTTMFSLIWLPPLLKKDNKPVNKRAFAIFDYINSHSTDTSVPVLVTIAVVSVICIGYYVYGGTSFDADLRNLGYIADDQLATETSVRQKISNGYRSQYFAAKGATMEEALDNFSQLMVILDSLKQEGIVHDYSKTTELFIPQKKQKQRIEAWQNYWNTERLETVRHLVCVCAPEAGLNPEAFRPFFDAASRDYETNPLYEAGIIPAGYLSTTMEQSYDSTYLCFSTVYCKLDSVRSDTTDYHKICDAVANRPNFMVLDTYYYASDNLRQLGNDFDVLQWVSMAFVLLVLFLSFKRNLAVSLCCFFPILISWIILLGVMNIFDRQFNLINIIISTFIFGIGVDYSIFIMCGLRNNSQDITVFNYHKTAIILSVLVLIITVGSMNFADHPAIRSVGFSTLVGLISAVIFAYLVEPYLYKRLVKN